MAKKKKNGTDAIDTNAVSTEQLLDMAKTLLPPTKEPVLKGIIVHGNLSRRKIRYRIFRIRENKDEIKDDDFKAFIQSQFKKGHNWNNFTFDWDVGVNDPLKVISRDMWFDEGGAIDKDGNLIPAGFTGQR